MSAEHKIKTLMNMKLCSLNKRYFADSRNIVNKRQSQLLATKKQALNNTPQASPFYENDPHDGVGVFMFLIAAVIVAIVLLMLFSQGAAPDNLTLKNSPMANKDAAITILESIKAFLKNSSK